jgi:hypothetical protein
MADTVSETMKSLSDQGVYSAILGFLFELRNVPEFSVLSELSFLTSNVDDFLNILEYFAGKTVKFPTESEIAESIQIIRLYQLYEIEKRPWKDAIQIVGFDTSSGKLAKNRLDRFKKMISEYNFSERSY